MLLIRALVLFLVSKVLDMVKRAIAHRIVRAYYNPQFPGSFGGLPAFRDALKRKLNIDISHSALKSDSLHYQVNVALSKHFKTRPWYTAGAFIQAMADPVFVPIEPGTM